MPANATQPTLATFSVEPEAKHWHRCDVGNLPAVFFGIVFDPAKPRIHQSWLGRADPGECSEGMAPAWMLLPDLDRPLIRIKF